MSMKGEINQCAALFLCPGAKQSWSLQLESTVVSEALVRHFCFMQHGSAAMTELWAGLLKKAEQKC